MMRSPKTGSWRYLIRELNDRMKPVKILAKYVEENEVLFWAKDTKQLAGRARYGASFSASTLPQTIQKEHRERVAELLNDVQAYYQELRRKREGKKRFLAELQQQISSQDRERMANIRDEYRWCLTYEDQRFSRLDSITAVKKWTTMSDLERESWFQRVETYARERKENDPAVRRQYEAERLRKEREKEQAEEFERKWQEQQRRFYERRSFNDLESILNSSAYRALGISIGASPIEIKQAWKRLVKEHHPDRGGDQRKFVEIQKAYEVLGGR